MAETLEAVPDAETIISSKDNVVPDFRVPPTTGSFVWRAETIDVGSAGGRTPEVILGDIVEAHLAKMSPQESDAAIERARAILCSDRSPKKQP